MLFAIFADSERYHLTTESGRTTLCGRTTQRGKFISSRVASARLSAQRPADYILCRRCEARQPFKVEPGQLPKLNESDPTGAKKAEKRAVARWENEGGAVLPLTKEKAGRRK